MVNPKKPRTPCLQCGKEPKCFGYKYCSNICQQKYQYKKSVKQWRDGTKKGLLRTGVVSGYVKRYLRKKINDKTEGLFEGAEEYYVTGREKAGKIVQEGKKKATEIIEDAKKKITTN